MLKRRTIFAIGLSALLSLATMAPALADQARGDRRISSANSAQDTTPYLKMHHRDDYRRHDHRPHWKEHRRAYRHDRRHYGNHHPYRNYRRGHDHDFANGLVFGGVLGYIIGNSY